MTEKNNKQIPLTSKKLNLNETNVLDDVDVIQNAVSVTHEKKKKNNKNLFLFDNVNDCDDDFMTFLNEYKISNLTPFTIRESENGPIEFYLYKIVSYDSKIKSYYVEKHSDGNVVKKSDMIDYEKGGNKEFPFYDDDEHLYLKYTISLDGKAPSIGSVLHSSEEFEEVIGVNFDNFVELVKSLEPFGKKREENVEVDKKDSTSDVNNIENVNSVEEKPIITQEKFSDDRKDSESRETNKSGKRLKEIEINDVSSKKPVSPEEITVKVNVDSTYEDEISSKFRLDDDDNLDAVPTEMMDEYSEKIKKVLGVDSFEGGNVKAGDFEEANKEIDSKNIEIIYDTNKSEGIDEDNTIEKMNELVEEANRKRFVAYEDSKDQLFKIMKNKRSNVISKIIETIDTTKINPKEVDGDEISTSAFLSKQIAPLLNPDISIVPLLISGYVVNISAFMYDDLIKVRQIVPEFDTNSPTERNIALLKKRKLELETIYNHIVCFQGISEKPSYDEFLEMVLLPDLPQLIFGSYAATYNQTQEYTAQCRSCGHTISVERTVKDLCHIISKNIDIDTIKKILNNTYPKDKISELPIVRDSKKVYVEEKPLPRSGIVLREKIPTLKEFLDGIEALTNIYEDDDLNDVDFFSLYYYGGRENERNYFLRECLFIHEMIVPSIKFDGEKSEASFHLVKDKEIIYRTLRKIHADDYKAIFRSNNLRRMTSIKGIQHYIKMDTCPNCGIKLEPFPFNAELIFFSEGWG